MSSVNDGAPWIERITALNFPHAIQIIDWRHAENRLWHVANTRFGERTQKTKHWVEVRLDHLWAGNPQLVVKALQQLNLARKEVGDLIHQTPAYFNSRQSKMEQAAFRQKGFPMGSGTVESGIKTVVHHRMKRPGRGWSRTNAQAMLAGLRELHSGRFISCGNLSIPPHPHLTDTFALYSNHNLADPVSIFFDKMVVKFFGRPK